MTRPDIVARRIGHERQPIAIVDHFHPDPYALRRFAMTARFGAAQRQYPGIRADLPPDYFPAVRDGLLPVVQQVFGHSGGIALLDASFSIVTTPPDRLSVQQRLPHFDAVDPKRIALVHYLEQGTSNGTGFYRHRATGFEAIDDARMPRYLDTLHAEVRHDTPPPAYIHGSTPQFERIAAVDGAYNRAVLYRSALLHSGSIAPDAVLSADPASGRLTVTAFLALT